MEETLGRDMETSGKADNDSFYRDLYFNFVLFIPDLPDPSSAPFPARMCHNHEATFQDSVALL